MTSALQNGRIRGSDKAPQHRVNGLGHGTEGATSMQDVPYGYCHCGCGQQTSLAVQTRASLGHVRGEPVRFVIGHGVRAVDLGERFGRLVVVADTGERTKGGHRMLLCDCDCGGRSVVAAGKLSRRDGTRSCGCLLRESNAKRIHPAIRFLSRIVEDGDCLIWTGARTRGGYGNFEGWLAHRFAFDLAHGGVPTGKHLHHVCERRACVNPSHLMPLAVAEHNRLHREQAR